MNGHLEGEQPYFRELLFLTIVPNHLLTEMILQVGYMYGLDLPTTQ